MHKLGMVVHTYYPSTGEVEAGGSEAQATLSYRVTSRPGYDIPNPVPIIKN